MHSLLGASLMAHPTSQRGALQFESLVVAAPGIVPRVRPSPFTPSLFKSRIEQPQCPREPCASGRSYGVSVPVTPPPEPPLQQDRVVPFALAGFVGITLFVWRQWKNSSTRKPRMSSGGQSQFDAALESSNPQDGREYRMALARTRQAVAIHRATGFLNSNNTARAMVELRRALHENSVCRSPLLNTQMEADQLQSLYRVHLEYNGQPADFATLLQLRTMLDLDFDVAERLEREVMEQGSAFSI